MVAPWDRAIADTALDDPPTDLAEALRGELASLWYSLHAARLHAMNGSWSMECEGLTHRIVNLSRLVGATPWGKIPIPMLADETYQGILTAAEIEFEPVDMDEVRKLKAELWP